MEDEKREKAIVIIDEGNASHLCEYLYESQKNTRLDYWEMIKIIAEEIEEQDNTQVDIKHVHYGSVAKLTFLIN